MLKKELIKVSILGAKGKMGQSLLEEFSKDQQFEIFYALVKESDPDLGKSITKNFAFENDLCYTSNVEKALMNSDVFIDFTIPSKIFFEILEWNKKYRKIIISGTTGYNIEELNEIRSYSEYFPMLMSSNFSIGMNILFHVLKEVALILNIDLDYDLEIIESHHRFKKDKPSGTAIDLNKIASSYSNRKHIDNNSIHSLREGNTVGMHEVRFTDLYESLRLSHHSYDRKAFSKGVVFAAKYLYHNKKNGFYSMDDIFNFGRLKN